MAELDDTFGKELDAYIEARTNPPLDNTDSPTHSHSILSPPPPPPRKRQQQQQQQKDQEWEHESSTSTSTELSRYLYNEETGLWYDTVTGEYSVYDTATQMYIPVKVINDDEDEDDGSREPKSNAVLRLVVIKSTLFTPGNVVLVDANGLTVGRDRSAWDTRLRLAEMPVSKIHCQIYCESNKNEPESFYIIDVGSRHGTFVNGERLSEPKKSSLPRHLKHQDQLKIGSTVLQVHWHDSSEWPCQQCKVDSCQIIDTTEGKRDKEEKEEEQRQRKKQELFQGNQRRKDLETTRRKELSRLKEIFAVPRVPVSALRQHTIEAEPSVVETVTNQMTPVQGVGDRMLRKMGWQDGQSLGKTGSGGILEPISATPQTERAGLGSQTSERIGSAHESPKTRAWRTAKERYDKVV
ncbi:SMAD/FHA domain-containing protein [Phycomyces blakesleeanus]|uniref:SMAD/FHA domain-containing protein n=1 Tax=Phycomyces blakesleeanus TaxID=4837 RepID=A0ABR3BHH5_PHYBL